MRSVTVTLLARDGFQKVIDVSERLYRHGLIRILAADKKSFRDFVQHQDHLTIFKERP